MAGKVQARKRAKTRALVVPSTAALFELSAEQDLLLGEALHEALEVKGKSSHYVTVHQQACSWMRSKCNCTPCRLFCGARA